MSCFFGWELLFENLAVSGLMARLLAPLSAPLEEPGLKFGFSVGRCSRSAPCHSAKLTVKLDKVCGLVIGLRTAYEAAVSC